MFYGQFYTNNVVTVSSTSLCFIEYFHSNRLEKYELKENIIDNTNNTKTIHRNDEKPGNQYYVLKKTHTKHNL
jgi:hypothetical protein